MKNGLLSTGSVQHCCSKGATLHYPGCHIRVAFASGPQHSLRPGTDFSLFRTTLHFLAPLFALFRVSFGTAPFYCNIPVFRAAALHYQQTTLVFQRSRTSILPRCCTVTKTISAAILLTVCRFCAPGQSYYILLFRPPGGCSLTTLLQLPCGCIMPSSLRRCATLR